MHHVHCTVYKQYNELTRKINYLIITGIKKTHFLYHYKHVFFLLQYVSKVLTNFGTVCRTFSRYFTLVILKSFRLILSAAIFRLANDVKMWHGPPKCWYCKFSKLAMAIFNYLQILLQTHFLPRDRQGPSSAETGNSLKLRKCPLFKGFVTGDFLPHVFK